MTLSERDRSQWLLDEIAFEVLRRSGGDATVHMHLMLCRNELEQYLDAETVDPADLEAAGELERIQRRAAWEILARGNDSTAGHRRAT